MAGGALPTTPTAASAQPSPDTPHRSPPRLSVASPTVAGRGPRLGLGSTGLRVPARTPPGDMSRKTSTAGYGVEGPWTHSAPSPALLARALVAGRHPPTHRPGPHPGLLAHWPSSLHTPRHERTTPTQPLRLHPAGLTGASAGHGGVSAFEFGNVAAPCLSARHRVPPRPRTDQATQLALACTRYNVAARWPAFPGRSGTAGALSWSWSRSRLFGCHAGFAPAVTGPALALGSWPTAWPSAVSDRRCTPRSPLARVERRGSSVGIWRRCRASATGRHAIRPAVELESHRARRLLWSVVLALMDCDGAGGVMANPQAVHGNRARRGADVAPVRRCRAAAHARETQRACYIGRASRSMIQATNFNVRTSASRTGLTLLPPPWVLSRSRCPRFGQGGSSSCGSARGIGVGKGGFLRRRLVFPAWTVRSRIGSGGSVEVSTRLHACLSYTSSRCPAHSPSTSAKQANNR